jgi:hypothetical protein
MSEFIREADPARIIPAPDKNNLWYVDRNTDDAIVFVHGIFSDSRGCWMANTDASEHDRYWPELVARDSRFDRFSIYLAGYFTQIDAGSFGIGNCAQQLFDALGEATRPNEIAPLARKTLVFVCHSTGGIVVRYMLESRVSAFSNKTIGLALIASPSYGARLANTMSSLMKLYGQKLGQQLAWANWGLEDLDARFRLLLAERRIPHLVGAEAYENRFFIHKKWLPRFASPLVEKESAARYFAPARQLAGTDHFSAVKPTAADHPSHLFLCAFLRKLESQEAEWGVKAQPNSRVAKPQEALAHRHAVRLRHDSFKVDTQGLMRALVAEAELARQQAAIKASAEERRRFALTMFESKIAAGVMRETIWPLLAEYGDVSSLQHFLEKFPNSEHAEAAKSKLSELERRAEAEHEAEEHRRRET